MIVIHHDIDLTRELFYEKGGISANDHRLDIGYPEKKQDKIMNFSGVYQPNGAAKESSQRVYTPSVWVSSR